MYDEDNTHFLTHCVITIKVIMYFNEIMMDGLGHDYAL